MKKYKLSKNSKNIVLAIIFSLAVAIGGNAMIKGFSSNKYALLTDEEIAQRNALLDNETEDDKSKYTTFGYVAEGTIIGVGLLSAGMMLKGNKKEEKYNEVKYYLKEDKNPVIGSKIKKIPCKKQTRRYDSKYRKITGKRRK